MYRFHRAVGADLEVTRSILEARRRWLHDRGSDQWSILDPTRDLEQSVEDGLVWLLSETETSQVVATMIMTTMADLDFWTPAERREPALYLSKIATDPAVAGAGLGRMLITCANGYAADRGIHRLRWDVWRTNDALQDYYRGIGARHLRTVDVPDRHSGALFDARDWPAAAPETVIMDTPWAVINELKAEVRTGRNSHVHLLADLYTCTDEGHIEAQQLVRSDLYLRRTLHHSGDVWHVDAARVTGPALDNLVPGRPYSLVHQEPPHAGCSAAIVGDVDEVPDGQGA